MAVFKIFSSAFKDPIWFIHSGSLIFRAEKLGGRKKQGSAKV
jgi:hypothetical protein